MNNNLTIAKPYKRLFAVLIDIIILIPFIVIAENAVTKIFNLPVTPIFSFSRGYSIEIDNWVREHFWQIVALYSATKFILVFLYYVPFEASPWQGTIGKKLLKIKVTDLNGLRISFKKSTVRLLSKLLSTQLLFGYIMILFTNKKQGLHDLIAKTLVMENKNKSSMKKQALIIGLLCGLLVLLGCNTRSTDNTSPTQTKSPEMTITVETMKHVLDAFNRHDLDAIMEYFAEDCSLDIPRGPEPWGQRFVGKAQVREALAGRFKGIPDVHYGEDAHWISADGNNGVSEWTLTGTTIAGIKVKVRGCDLWEFRNGKIIRKNSFWKIVER